MRSVLSLSEVVSCSAGDNFLLELDIVAENFLEGELFGFAVDKSNHDNAEGCLKLCEAEKLVENNLGICISLEVN